MWTLYERRRKGQAGEVTISENEAKDDPDGHLPTSPTLAFDDDHAASRADSIGNFIGDAQLWAGPRSRQNTGFAGADRKTCIRPETSNRTPASHCTYPRGKRGVPTTWFQAFNPFMIFAFTPFIIALWAWQEKRGSEPSTVTKMTLGCFAVAASYLIMTIAAWQAAGDKANWLWLFAFFIVVTIGELYLSPIGLSLVSKVAPARMLSLMMGLWLATSFIGNLIAGWLGGLWSGMDSAKFFLMIAAFAAAAGVATAFFIRPLKPILER
jgi:hypothetical protein